MREDMAKVIVERPRLINSNPIKYDGRIYRNSDETPNRMGMQRGYSNRKYFNENLAPLRRFLESQVNRPWNKVYAEIRAQIDGRSTVQQHILQHLEQFVEIHTRWDAEKQLILIQTRQWHSASLYLRDSSVELYVDPRSGLLMKNRHYQSYATKQKHKKAEAQKAEEQIRRIISQHIFLRKIDGIWYRVELADLPPMRQAYNLEGSILHGHFVADSVWDVVCGAWVSRSQNHSSNRKHECDKCETGQRYAVKKQQLSSKEIKQLKLA